MQMLVGIPGRTFTPPHKHAVSLHYLAAEQHVAVPQIQHKAVVLPFRIAVAVVGHAPVGGKLHGGAGVVQQHLVVTRLRHLVFVAEMAFVTQRLCDSVTQRLRDRHQQHITVVRAAGAAEVGVAEAVDGVVTIVVAAAAVPTVQPRVGRRLYLPEWHYGSREGVTVTVGTHHGVDVRCQRLFAAAGKKQCRHNENEYPFHMLCLLFYSFGILTRAAAPRMATSLAFSSLMRIWQLP